MIPWSPRRFIMILLGLFVLNWLIVAVFAPPEKRIKIPYSPTFLEQVRKGNVKEISASGDTVKGEFKKEVKYKGESAKGFETEIPTFANDRELSQLLEEQRRRDQRLAAGRALAARDDPVQLRAHDPARGAVHLPVPPRGRRRGRRRRARPVRPQPRRAGSSPRRRR